MFLVLGYVKQVARYNNRNADLHLSYSLDRKCMIFAVIVGITNLKLKNSFSEWEIDDPVSEIPHFSVGNKKKFDSVVHFFQLKDYINV